jgi:hypothetical protein
MKDTSAFVQSTQEKEQTAAAAALKRPACNCDAGGGKDVHFMFLKRAKKETSNCIRVLQSVRCQVSKLQTWAFDKCCSLAAAAAAAAAAVNRMLVRQEQLQLLLLLLLLFTCVSKLAVNTPKATPSAPPITPAMADFTPQLFIMSSCKTLPARQGRV